MTFLIVPAPDGTSWTEAYFPGMSPLHLGVVAKSWAEHLLDWCQMQGATAVKILDHFHDEALVRGHLGDGSRWGFRLAYEGAGRFASREDAVRRNRAFAAGDGDVRVVWGPVFPHRGEWTRVDSLRAWFDLNFRVLADPADRTLPGYSSEPGVSIGENVMIKTRADVRRPVALGDNVRIEDGVTLAGDVIVGAGTFVEPPDREQADAPDIRRQNVQHSFLTLILRGAQHTLRLIHHEIPQTAGTQLGAVHAYRVPLLFYFHVRLHCRRAVDRDAPALYHLPQFASGRNAKL